MQSRQSLSAMIRRKSISIWKQLWFARLTLLLWGCSSLWALATPVWAQQPQEEQAAEYFETHIRPLFVRRCYQCHSEKTQESELLLDRQGGWIAGGPRGPSVVPGDPEASLLIQAVRYRQADLEMPPSGPLPEAEIERLETWIRMGAPGPHGPLSSTVDDPSDPIAGKEHWAFQPLRDVSPPTVRDASWPRNAIDCFILAKLESAGLKPAADASPREVIERLSIQLNGLPASLGFSERFLQDPSPAGVARVVDTLLAAPQFGQRWGRHWLDLARYADSNGLDENFLFREAWRYRNWVIDATNADMAYDRFLTEQIAGDLLPYLDIDQRDRQRIATGFMVVGPKVLLGINPEQQRMDVADEHIDSIGRAVLAQTLGCARCHDHKFDPIPTADYYALAGIFTSTCVMETRHMLGQQRHMEQLIGLGTDGSDADTAYEAYWRELPATRAKKAQADKALQLLRKENSDEFAKLLEEHPNCVSPGAQDPQQELAERIADQQQFVAELAAVISNPPAIPPRAMICSEIQEPADVAIRLAGQFDDLGDVVPRGFLSVLNDGCSPEIPVDQSGRLALVQWLTDANTRAGQLTARVYANRIWQHLIGRGLVRTVDNFGRTGESPTHPELLDYLAQQLIDSNWSTKALVRQIVTSRTFAMSSRYSEAGHALDPENELLWRAHRRRLEPEVLRDALLQAAGQLDFGTYASTVDYLGDQATAVGDNKVRRRTDFPCRSVYLPVIRNDLPEIFEAFDFTNPHTTTGSRPATIVPSQGLFMLNDQMVMESALATARRIHSECSTGDLPAQIDFMIRLILRHEPTPDEQRSIASFVRLTELSFHQDCVEEAECKALAVACHALFASSRFQFVD